LLVSLLPRFVHVRGEQRLATLVQLVGEESRSQRPARDLVLARLLEVLLIEALRSTAATPASSGLVRGLADERLAAAIRRMHENPARAWTVAQLANEAALSRSAFFARFNRAVGLAPMEYLLAWRMAIAKKMLRQHRIAVADVAGHVGYSSASTFNVAFTRYVGLPPMRYARGVGEARPA
jgi:transcriptional regulator GlxA family with amidase domain